MNWVPTRLGEPRRCVFCERAHRLRLKSMLRFGGLSCDRQSCLLPQQMRWQSGRGRGTEPRHECHQDLLPQDAPPHSWRGCGAGVGTSTSMIFNDLDIREWSLYWTPSVSPSHQMS